MRIVNPPGSAVVNVSSSDWIHFDPAAYCQPFHLEGVVAQGGGAEENVYTGFATQKLYLHSVHLRLRRTVANVGNEDIDFTVHHFHSGSLQNPIFKVITKIPALNDFQDFTLPAELLFQESQGIHIVYNDHGAVGEVSYSIDFPANIIAL